MTIRLIDYYVEIGEKKNQGCNEVGKNKMRKKRAIDVLYDKVTKGKEIIYFMIFLYKKMADSNKYCIFACDTR